MGVFVSRPQHVEALQWTGENGLALLDAFGGKVTIQHRGDHHYICNLLAGNGGEQGWVPVPVGSWIVHLPDDLSDIWPVTPKYFQSKYEPADG